jgi:hypothetical protein
MAAAAFLQSERLIDGDEFFKGDLEETVIQQRHEL